MSATSAHRQIPSTLDEQNKQIGTPRLLIAKASPADQIGGSMRALYRAGPITQGELRRRGARNRITEYLLMNTPVEPELGAAT